MMSLNVLEMRLVVGAKWNLLLEVKSRIKHL